MSWLLVAPIAIPLIAAVFTFLAHGHRSAQRLISTAGAAALLAASVMLLATVWSNGIVSAGMGSWPPPFGINLVADHLSAIMVLLAGVFGFLIVVYALSDITPLRERLGFHPFYHMMLAGVSGACLTGDLFNMYVWIDVMLIAASALLILGGDKVQIDGAVKYIVLNIIGTILLLAGIGLLYGMTGTLNMAELHLRVREVDNQGLLSAVAILFLIALGIKTALFPLFFWLPASYHTPPIAIAAIFSALLTKVGVYALIRVFTLIFTHDIAYTHTIILIVAIITMVTGVLGAAAHNEVRRILAFHIISQIGYIILGLGLLTPLSLAGAAYFLVHTVLAKVNLFLIGGVLRRYCGSFELSAIGGLSRSAPVLAAAFLVSALSLGGMPPLSGFWAKLLLAKASLDLAEYAAAAAVLGVGLLTLYSMSKIWIQGFWKPPPATMAAEPAPLSKGDLVVLYGPILVIGGIIIVMGVWAEPFIVAGGRAAADLLDPARYLEAVLGEDAVRGGAP